MIMVDDNVIGNKTSYFDDVIIRTFEPDADNDGIPDSLESTLPTFSAVGDTDQDGIPDHIEIGPVQFPYDTDGDGIIDANDSDSDGDGCPDSQEYTPNACPKGHLDPNITPPLCTQDSNCPGVIESKCQLATGRCIADFDGDGVADENDPDADNDGILDRVEGGGRDWSQDANNNGIPDFRDLDADGDGIFDVIEANEGAGDTDNDGMLDGGDSDDDGVANNVDRRPNNPNNPNNTSTTTRPPNTDNDGHPAYLDIDSDGDGALDSAEFGKDVDNDGIPDYLDTSNPNLMDSDGDGILDAVECTNPMNCEDTDNDGTPDYQDDDDDNDGLPSHLDIDADGDGITDAVECSDGTQCEDTDKNGMLDYLDLDADGDNIVDAIEGNDVNHDGKADTIPTGVDADNDGLDDAFDAENGTDIPGVRAQTPDLDGDMIPDFRDIDDDNDGINTVDEDTNGDGNWLNDDADGDGTPDYLDPDTGNGYLLAGGQSACSTTSNKGRFGLVLIAFAFLLGRRRKR